LSIPNTATSLKVLAPRLIAMQNSSLGNSVNIYNLKRMRANDFNLNKLARVYTLREARTAQKAQQIMNAINQIIE
jgi:hypothetical protein